MQIVLPVNALKAAYSDVTVVIWALSVVGGKRGEAVEMRKASNMWLVRALNSDKVR